MRRNLLGCAVVVSMFFAAEAAADYRDDIGYWTFLQRYGHLNATGQGVRVAQVELNDGNSADGRPDFIPSASNADFLSPNKSFNVITPSGYSGADASGHATTVGQYFYGKNTSVAGGVSSIDLYLADTFINGNYLRMNSLMDPRSTAPTGSVPSARIANHSWVGNTGNTALDADILLRLDYLVDRDNFIQVVGAPLSYSQLLAQGWNDIAVGASTGSNGGGTAMSTYYSGGRLSPDLVGPSTTISYATPVVAATAAVLVGHAHANPSLSKGMDQNTRDGQTIYHGETSQAIKAILMAGARRDVIAGYTPGTNNIDMRYGAGMVNIHRSFEILVAGEQDPLQDGGGQVGSVGWDFNPSFGGSADESVAEYFFDVADGWRHITATLAWNVVVDITKVRTGVGQDLVNAETLRNLDLALYRITDSSQELVQQSTSTNNNVENLFYQELVGGRYKLQVTALGGSYDIQYGLAWYVVPEPASLSVLGLGAAVLLRRRR